MNCYHEMNLVMITATCSGHVISHLFNLFMHQNEKGLYGKGCDLTWVLHLLVCRWFLEVSTTEVFSYKTQTLAFNKLWKCALCSFWPVELLCFKRWVPLLFSVCFRRLSHTHTHRGQAINQQMLCRRRSLVVSIQMNNMSFSALMMFYEEKYTQHVC